MLTVILIEIVSTVLVQGCMERGEKFTQKIMLELKRLVCYAMVNFTKQWRE